MIVLRRFALALAVLGVAAPGGCGDKQLKKVRVPAGGVALAYDLEPDTAYAGDVEVGVTRQIDGLDEPLTQSLSVEVLMVVLGDAPDGGKRVRVTLTHGDLDWALLPESGYTREKFLQLAVERLKGLHLPMTIGPHGTVVERPPVLDDVPPELADVIDAVVDAVAQSFVGLPGGKLERGDDYQPPGTGQMRGTFEGLYRHVERDEQVAQLHVDLHKIPLTPAGKGERKGQLDALFATEGYPAQVDVETQDFDPQLGMSFRRIQVSWKKTDKSSVPLSIEADTAEDVQVIRDPCNPDYVGPEPCKETAPPPAPEDDEDEHAEEAEDDEDTPAEDAPLEEDDEDDEDAAD